MGMNERTPSPGLLEHHACGREWSSDQDTNLDFPERAGRPTFPKKSSETPARVICGTLHQHQHDYVSQHAPRTGGESNRRVAWDFLGPSLR